MMRQTLSPTPAGPREAGAVPGLPHPLDAPAPKAFRTGTHRFVSPAETLARMQPLLPLLGITRLANLTGLDHIGIPTVAAYRPNSRSLAVSLGKGLDVDAAKASALMESLEAWHAERITLPLKLASFLELRYEHRVVDVSQLPRPTDSVFHPRLPLLWIEGFDLLQHEPVWLPYELVHLNYTLPMPPGSGCFRSSSNGLASGNHLLEAISHAICEVVERDATTLWHLAADEEQRATRVNLTTVDDPLCQQALALYDRAGVAVAVWETTSDLGLSAYTCLIADRHDDPLRRLPIMDGFGCHPRREVALLRALTEAAQSRLTLISGARDNMSRASYAYRLNPDVAEDQRALFAAHAPGRHFAASPSFDGATFNDDVLWELDRLRAAGIERVVLVDLTRSDLRVPVARIVIPGLEPSHSGAGYAPGPRARARLEALP